MRIITVNLPESYLKAMDKLIGEKAFYPSRSELIRVAAREFLIKELETMKNMGNFTQDLPELKEHKPCSLNQTGQMVQTPIEEFIQVPIESEHSNEKHYKTFRIIKK